MDPDKPMPESQNSLNFPIADQNIDKAKKSGKKDEKSKKVFRGHTFAKNLSGTNLEKEDKISENTQKLLKKKSSIHYLDSRRLLKGTKDDQPIESKHRDWYLNEAILLSHSKAAGENGDLILQKKLELAAIHGYSKAATVSEKDADSLEIQTSPFMHGDNRYHRSSHNALIDRSNEAISQKLGVEEWEAQVVQSALLNEVFARVYPHEGLDLNIDSLKKFDSLINKLFENAVKGEFPPHRVLIDISQLLKNENIPPREVKALMKEFERIFLSKLDDLIDKNPGISYQTIGEKLLNKLHVVAFTTFDTDNSSHNVLLTPEFLQNPNSSYSEANNKLLSTTTVANRLGDFAYDLKNLITSTGFRVDPEEAKEVMLITRNASSILKSLGLAEAELATKGSHFPKVCDSMELFVKMPVLQKFKELDGGGEALYLNILSKATARLLEGFSGMGIDKAFEDLGLTDMLQISYFRIQNAMNEAILRKDDQVAFQNQIELIHQEIQNILKIASPYGEDSLANAISTKLTSGMSPIIPKELGNPLVHLKPSAMHCLASVVAGVEKEKGTNKLNLAILKDSYYESPEALGRAKTHSRSVFDGDKFNTGGIKAAFENAPPIPLDLFICEIHHNISTTRQSYTPERIAEQVISMYSEGMVAKKFTLVIDSTIDTEKSSDIQALLKNEDIQQLIKKGRLNIVFLRSAQKFDMLGMDNYYGGITTTVNNGKSFETFNNRMNDKNDQQRGINYQGLAHLHTHARDAIDEYRLGIMKNTRKLYEMLPEESIYHQGSTNPMQISEIKDNKIVFLDIKFPKHKDAAEVFQQKLKKLAIDEKLPFTTRASFGFSNTNFTIIEGHKFRLNPGLDDVKNLTRYAVFFHAVQESIESSMKKADESKDELMEKAVEKVNKRLEESKQSAIASITKTEKQHLVEIATDALMNEINDSGETLDDVQIEKRINERVERLIDSTANAMIEKEAKRRDQLILQAYDYSVDRILSKGIRLINVPRT